jgi:hypothetical protein
MRNILDEVGWKLAVVALLVGAVQPLGIYFVDYIDDFVFLRKKKRNKQLIINE